MFNWVRRRMIDKERIEAMAPLLGALVVGIVLAAPAAAQVSVESGSVTSYTVTPERLAASLAAVVALVAAIVGGLALARSSGRAAVNGRRRAIMAMIMGPIGAVIGGLVVVTADGGLGTGNGLGGGVVAMAVGVIGMVLAWLALSRSRRTA
jgi:hypothetical protein